MIRQPPQPTHPHLLGRDPAPAPFPSPPHTLAIRDHAHPNFRPFEPPGVESMPQQYAYPVPRSISYASGGSSRDDAYSGLKHSEHMLRRKTPNGILNAAYDGTSVEQTERPHAMKHILLPVSHPLTDRQPMSLGYGGAQELPLRLPANSWMSGRSQTHPQSRLPSDKWMPEAQCAGPRPQNNWTLGQQQQLPQIDSMLNQLPAQGPLPYQNIGVSPYGFISPPTQPTFGPTASNDSGPWGPYWPNGSFEPYRPAALRDMRYYPHPTANWTGYSAHAANGLLRNNWNLNNSPAINSMGALGPAKPYQGGIAGLGIHSQSPLPRPPLQSGPVYRGHRANDSHFVASNNRSAIPTGFVTPPYTGQTNNSFSAHGSESGQSTPTPHSQPEINPVASEPTPEFPNERLRENIFTWAHSIYVDLLRYLKELRSRTHGRGGHHPNRGSMYPKPPRQPSYDFAGSSAPQRKLERRSSSHGEDPNSDSHHAHHQVANYPRSQTQNPTLNVQNGHQWPSQGQPAPKLDRHNSWSQSSLDRPTFPPSSTQSSDRLRTLRRASGPSFSLTHIPARQEASPTSNASAALSALTELCQESSWKWVDGMLLGGCLAYALADYQKAMDWYTRILNVDTDNVEAMSNLAATLFAMNRKHDAELQWRRAVQLRPSYFEAVEHLIGLLCGEQRGKEAVEVIEFTERTLRLPKGELGTVRDRDYDPSPSACQSPSFSEASDRPFFDFDGDGSSPNLRAISGQEQQDFGSSGFAIPDSDVGRLLQLIHAKGNMLYAMGDILGAAKSFEDAVLLGTGRGTWRDLNGLIKHILSVLSRDVSHRTGYQQHNQSDPILLAPEEALATHRLCFPQHGHLPGIKGSPNDDRSTQASYSTTSNSLLSLAKIFQDGMASNSPRTAMFETTYGVRDILALYYLSLALQQSPSTANNVGILLASVQQSVPPRPVSISHPKPLALSGVAPGSGVALALSYYEYGLRLDNKHAHLYTNLGSLLKDIGHLQQAIRMYENAVSCDKNFDIALANLANAVKDQGRIADAIGYYKRAVDVNSEFAEAVCGLANALNSVCGWAGRGGIAADSGRRDRWHVGDKGMLKNATLPGAISSGWIQRVVDLVDKQLGDGEEWGKGLIDGHFVDQVLRTLPVASGDYPNFKDNERNLAMTIKSWSGTKWEGAKTIRLIERIMKRLTWQWYHDKYIRRKIRPINAYNRPTLPSSATIPAAPTVLPFHTFTLPMSAKQIRNISQRNGLRISCSALKAPWLPKTAYPPPRPPNPYLKVGYVSSDFNNHPLAHLMQSVFGMHDPRKVKAICYATTASDNSVHRQQIEREAPIFHDASNWATDKLVKKIVEDGCHILVNLNGYTRGARNEVFAARPAPVQMSFMGFAGTLGAEWCDYLLADETAVPRDTLRPWRRNVDLEDQLIDDTYRCEDDDLTDSDWIYSENIIYCRDTFFCCDHRQSGPDAQGKQPSWEEELERRWAMRKEIFPSLSDDAIILGNFNQLYKIEPTTFRTWLRILAQVPKAVLWLLRFPDLGEQYLKQTALQWAGKSVADRVIFTDVAPKHLHISRARVCDLFLDTPECNAHTTAADTLWSGTPLLTLPRYKYKMCSRMAASILKGALPKNRAGDQAARELIVDNEDQYEQCAINLANGLKYHGHTPIGRLADLRKLLYESRWTSALFDTRRWTRDLEEAYEIAWKRWVKGEGGDIDLSPHHQPEATTRSR